MKEGLRTDPRPCMTRELGLCHHHSSSRGLVLPLLSSPYNHFQAFQSSTVVTGWEASERSGPDQTTGDDDRRRKVGRFLTLTPCHRDSSPTIPSPSPLPFLIPLRSIRFRKLSYESSVLCFKGCKEVNVRR